MTAGVPDEFALPEPKVKVSLFPNEYEKNQHIFPYIYM